MIEEIRKSLERLEYYEALAEQKQDAWDADPLNPDREEAADRAYDLQFREFVHAAHLLSRFAGMSEKEARLIISQRRSELLKILAEKEALNSMCTDCSRLGTACEGTTCQTWTGCVYKSR